MTKTKHMQKSQQVQKKQEKMTLVEQVQQEHKKMENSNPLQQVLESQEKVKQMTQKTMMDELRERTKMTDRVAFSYVYDPPRPKKKDSNQKKQVVHRGPGSRSVKVMVYHHNRENGMVRYAAALYNSKDQHNKQIESEKDETRSERSESKKNHIYNKEGLRKLAATRFEHAYYEFKADPNVDILKQVKARTSQPGGAYDRTMYKLHKKALKSEKKN